MKIIKILGIAAGLHAVLALILVFASPGCSDTKAAAPDASPFTAAPAGEAPAPAQGAAEPAPDAAVIRYSPTRPGTAVASALEAQPVADVTPATTYTVERGDSLWSIAKKNQLSKADLAAANNLRASSILHVGQKLVIPSKSVAPMAATATAPAAGAAEAAPAEKAQGETVRHVVAPGETLGGIARKYGVRQGDIAVANNITDPRKIQPGQELVIPARSASGLKAAKPRPDTMAADKGPMAPAAPAPGQDLDAGLKPSGSSDVPVVKIADPAVDTQPKNP